VAVLPTKGHGSVLALRRVRRPNSMYARRMRSWKASGYHVSLHFIELPSEDLAVRRVAMRGAAGGHSVPEADVRRRYHRGLALWEQVYKPQADEQYHWLSDDEGLRLGQRHDG
jgi:predicted ABC-type ATPase